ncbi:MAG: hypothetical protein JXR11_05240 [Balneola sp.]
MKILTSKLHGIIDYVVVVFLLASPSLFGLPEFTACCTYILAGIHLTLTVLTDFEVGLFKVIPFKIHGLIELIVSLALIGFAFYLGGREGDLARNFYLCFGIAVFLTWLISDYKKNEN